MSTAPRRSTSVILRCREAGHQLMSIHPAIGANRFLVIRAAGRAGRTNRDTDEWLRTGHGDPGFATLPELSREIGAADAGTAAGLLGDSPFLFCRCGGAELDDATADAIGEALYRWHEQSRNGAKRPLTVVTAICR